MKTIEIWTDIKLFSRKVWNRYTVFSFISAIFLLVINYFANNLPVLTGEDLDQFYATQLACEILRDTEDHTYDSCCFYNVSYDKQLVYTYDKDGDVIRTGAITDRQKLLYLLQLIEKSGTYKYVILDLMFCEGDSTEYDDELFRQIAMMDRIVFAKHDSIKTANPSINNKSAITQYYSTITATNFTRYEYLRGDERYLPLKVYEDLNPEKRMTRYGWRWLSLYFSGHKLCQNSVFLTFNTDSFTDKVIVDSLKQVHAYYNLGEDVICNISDEIETLNEESMIRNMRVLHKDKYIIIGNLVDDVHDTYAGIKPGGIIILRAIQSLEEGKNIVRPSIIIVWLLVYFFISLFICTGRNVINFLPFIRDTKYKFIHYLVDVVSFTFILFVLQVVEYALFHTVHSQLVVIIYFAVIKAIFHYKKYEI